MANPAFVRALSRATQNFVNTDTVNVDLGADPNTFLLVEALDGFSNPGRYPSSITIGGVTMNASSVTFDAVNGNGYAAFSLGTAGGLPNGVQPLTIQMASGTGVGRPQMIISVYAAATAAALSAPSGANGSTITKTVTTTAGQLVVAHHIAGGSGTATITPNGAAVERLDDAGYFNFHVMEQLAAGSSTTISAAIAGGNQVWFGHAWALTGTGGDTTPPTLTSPTGTSTGSTTATGSVVTDDPTGTLYRLASTNATESVATIKAAGLSQAVSATGVQTVSFAGLTASTTYYPHYVHTDPAGNDSAVANGASFTTGSAGDTTVPVLTGAITVGAVTTNSITVSHPAGTDNVAVATYEYSKDGGVTYVASNSTATSYTFTGLTAGTSYSLRVRARDAAGNVSTPALSITQSTSAATVATITSDVFTGPFGNALQNTTIENVVVMDLNRTVVLSMTSQVTNGAGRLVISSASLVAGTTYLLPEWNADGSAAGNKAYVAA